MEDKPLIFLISQLTCIGLYLITQLSEYLHWVESVERCLCVGRLLANLPCSSKSVLLGLCGVILQITLLLQRKICQFRQQFIRTHTQGILLMQIHKLKMWWIVIVDHMAFAESWLILTSRNIQGWRVYRNNCPGFYMLAA